MRVFANRKENQPDENRWCFWRWLDIRDDYDDYLTRLTVFRCPWFGILLHWIKAPDPLEDLHDHPWPFVGVVLAGSYTEIVATPDGSMLLNGHYNHVDYLIKKTDPNEAHAIVAVDRAVTLILIGRPRKDWSFFTPLGAQSPADVDCLMIQDKWKDRLCNTSW